MLLGGGDVADRSSRDNARACIQTRKTLLAFQHAVGAPERAPFPVIAAVHGHVIGLGVDLISACDIRYTASNSAFSIKVGSKSPFNSYLTCGLKHSPMYFQKTLIGSRYWFSPRCRFSRLSPENHKQPISRSRTHLYSTFIFSL